MQARATWKAIALSMAFVTVLAAVMTGGFGLLGRDHVSAEPNNDVPSQTTSRTGSSEAPHLELTKKQLEMIKIASVEAHTFKIEKHTIGSIDYNEDSEVQVFTPYQGRIIAVFVQLDDKVKTGQPLFTIDSADLLQAESTLVQTSGVYDLTGRTLTRVKRLLPAGGGSQKDVEQATSDQQTAEGNLKAARNALHIFGKDEAEIDRIVGSRVVDSTLVVKSPIDGVVGARNAAPGLFIQPGTAPAPLTVANIKSKWMVASAAETDSSALRIGQDVVVKALAVADRTFKGRITAIGESIDPATRRFMVRSEVDDPENVLRPGMFADFSISTGSSISAAALPVSGAVREGDGTMTAWITQDRRRFEQRVVKLGLEQNGLYQVVDGLRTGELVVTDGAIFLDNILNAPPSD